MSLTVGAVSAFAANRDVAKPVVQVLQINKIDASNSAMRERFKMVISDGQHCMSAMLSTQLNDLVKTNKVQQNTVVTLSEYICNEVQGRNIVIVLGLEVQKLVPKIGNPQNIEKAGGAKQQQQQPAQPAAPVNPMYSGQPPQQRHPQNQNASRQYAQPPQQNQHQQQQQQKSFQNNSGFQGQGAVVRQPNMMQSGASNEEHLVPIRALNPYQNRWTFKARVTNRGDIRTWDKGGTNKGKLFSMECVDKDGTEIRCTFFRDAVDSYYDVLTPGGVFTFSKGQVKMANKAYNTTNNDYEITFGPQCEIQPCENDATIKTVSLNPVPIANIDPAGAAASVDVLGIVQDFGEVQQFTSRSNKELTKMEITLADNSNASVKLTLWGDRAHQFHKDLSDSQPNQVLGVKGCKVSDYNGCSLSSMSSSSMFLNPDIPQTAALQAWAQSGGLGGSIQSKSQQQGGQSRGTAGLTDRYGLSSFESHGLGQGEKGDYVDVTGTVTYIKRENMWYPACPEEGKSQEHYKGEGSGWIVGENKKVVLQTDGTWYCEKTNKTYQSCEYRYILSCLVSDASGSRWVTCFNETGMQILGNKSANDMQSLKQNNEAAFDQMILDANFKTYNMTLRVKEEIRDETPRLRCSVVRMQFLDFVNEGKQLLAAIEQYKNKPQL